MNNLLNSLQTLRKVVKEHNKNSTICITLDLWHLNDSNNPSYGASVYIEDLFSTTIKSFCSYEELLEACDKEIVRRNLLFKKF